MNIRIYNISLDTTDAELRKLFHQYGDVDHAKVNRNPLNGRSLKSGEICMPVAAQARQAMVSLDNTIFDGKVITVSELPPELF